MNIGTKIRHQEAWGMETYIYQGLLDGQYDTHHFLSEDGEVDFTCDTTTLPLLQVVVEEN